MSVVFLQGPLAAQAVVEAVFGAPVATTPIALPDHWLMGAETPVPDLVAAAGDRAEGAVATLTLAQAARWHQVALALGLLPRAVALPGGQAALAFCPTQTDGAPWCDAPAPGWAAILASAVVEITQDMTAEPPQSIAARLPTVLQRAASRARAAAAPPKPAASGFTLSDVQIVRRDRPYASFFAIEELTFAHPRFDGTEHPPVLRAVFMAADAVTVLPYDPVRDRVLLVEQVRASPIARGDPGAWILEPVAGRIEPGHTPEETARKEAQEEAGLTLKDLHFIGDYYPSTGCFSEYLYSYVATADLPDDAAGLGGVLAEGEDIRAHILPRTELLARVQRHEIPDGPLLFTVYWLEYHLDRLRGAS